MAINPSPSYFCSPVPILLLVLLLYLVPIPIPHGVVICRYRHCTYNSSDKHTGAWQWGMAMRRGINHSILFPITVFQFQFQFRFLVIEIQQDWTCVLSILRYSTVITHVRGRIVGKWVYTYRIRNMERRIRIRIRIRPLRSSSYLDGRGKEDKTRRKDSRCCTVVAVEV